MIIALVCSNLCLCAQNSIKGTVTDTAGQPVPYCSLVLLHAKDSSIYKGNVTDEKGEFVYEKIAAGDYLVKFSNVAFQTSWSQPFTIDSSSQLVLPPQVMKAEGVALKEVAVVAFKPTVEFKNGTVVMNVENNIISGGNTVFELLKRVPGVTVDAQNNINVNGRGGVRFMFDGRLQQIPTGQLINMLMGMPAESVSYIELIKNPPAKYDAAGTGGLINIVMKKAKVKGFSGSVSQSGSHGDQWRGGTFVSLNYKNDKFTFFSNLNTGYFHFETINYFYRRISTDTSLFEALSQGRQDELRFGFYGNAGIEYQASKKTTLGLNGNWNINQVNNQENSQIAIQNGNIFEYNYIKYNIATNQHFQIPGLNVNATHKFDTLTQLTFSADYTNFLDDYSRYTTNHYYNNANSEVQPTDKFGTSNHNNFNIYTQKLDLTRTFKKGFDLEAGVKGTFADNHSQANVQMTDTTGNLVYNSYYSNNYLYKEQILAGYLTLGKSFKKLNFRGGLRTEHTLVNGNNYPKSFVLHRDYINFFPSGSADYKINDKNNVQATYSYRIGRPGYDQMSPLRIFNDRFSNGVGNPQLKPMFTHAITVDYNYNNFITLSGSYQHTKDNIYYYSYGDPKTKVNIDSIFNFQFNDNFNLSLFAQKQFKWLNFNSFIMGNYRHNATLVNGYNTTNRQLTFYGNCTIEFLLPKNIKIQLQGFYETLSKDGIQTYYPFGIANFTILKSFLNKKLDVSFSIFDVFYGDTRPWENRVGGQYTYYTERHDSRRLRLWIVWKFGKMRINQNIKRSNEEESNRLKKAN